MNKLFKRNQYYLIATLTLMGAFIGAISYLIIPTTYTASGSFYITRMSNTGNGNYFAYDGYYSQQTALSYTTTVIGLLESSNIRSKALEKQGKEITGASLRKFNRQITTKKPAPQVITLTVKDYSQTSASQAWKALVEELLQITKDSNVKGDPLLSITPISTEPIVVESFHNIFVNIIAGAGGMLIAYISLLLIKKDFEV